MGITDLKDLEKLFKLCRKHGIAEMDHHGIKFKLGDPPREGSTHNADDSGEVPTDNPYANFPTGVLTPEQLMFYSAGGLPEEDPTLQKETA